MNIATNMLYVALACYAVGTAAALLALFVKAKRLEHAGMLAMIGGFSKVVQDVPPFMMADGRPSRVYGLNVLGLRRAGVVTATRAGLKQLHTSW